jgi:F-type H+-transporting ATPase subunit gamma
MPSLKHLRNRISGVKSTKKITSAMKLVAGARLKRAQIAATTSRPYVAKIEGLINNITSSVQNIENLPKIVKGSESNKIHLIVLITSDRGLCGSFNTAMVKLAKKRINELLNSNKIVKILCVGKKGYNQLKREYQDIIIDTIILPYKSDKVDYEFAQKISHRILMMHENNEFDFASIVFSLFQSPLKQEPQLKQIIPVLNNDEKATKNNLESIDKKIYEYEPEEEYILKDLVPLNISIQIYRGLLENAAGEEGARMTAMDNATRNAGELIDSLTLNYNRSRQAQITKELIEVISGAEAV